MSAKKALSVHARRAKAYELSYAIINDVDERSRENIKSRVAVTKRQKSFVERNLCSICFLTKECCICDQVRSIFKDVPRPRADIVVFQHYKEYGRASNTAKLLEIGLGSKVCLFGNNNDCAELQEVLLNGGFIVYPGPSSQPICNFKHTANEKADGSGHVPTICLLDGTWNQASLLNKTFPNSILRVNVDAQINAHTPAQPAIIGTAQRAVGELAEGPVLYRSEFLSRKQNEDRWVKSEDWVRVVEDPE